MEEIWLFKLTIVGGVSYEYNRGEPNSLILPNWFFGRFFALWRFTAGGKFGIIEKIAQHEGSA